MIGIIGLGNMGSAIAKRLIDQGEQIIVWNRSAAKTKELSQATIAESPLEVVQSSDVVLSVLANDEANQAVYFGPQGIVSHNLGGTLIVDLSTMAPASAQALEAAVLKQDGQFLECPVGGTIGPALEGKLLGLAGGSADAFAAATPVLEKLTRRLEHFGPVGTGAAMKLAINLPLMVYWSALGESLGIALSHNIDASLALDVLSDTSGAIGAAKKRVPPIRDKVVNGESGNVNFSVENAIKDMELMVATMSEKGLDAEGVVSKALAHSRQAQQEGFAGLDCSLVAAFRNENST